MKEYFRLRKLGFRHKHAAELSGLNSFYRSIGSALFIIAVLLVVLAIHKHLVSREVEHVENSVAAERQEHARANKLIAAMLNGQAIRDAVTGHVYFIEMSEQRGGGL